jgi:hypothetical protein
MTYNQPLNPTLHRKLVQRFGKDNVSIASPGQAIYWRITPPIGWRGQNRPSRTVSVSGEEYFVPCPFCKDYKKRLSINHMWGVWDPESYSNNLWLAQCYNEQCLGDYALQQALFLQLYGVNSNTRNAVPIIAARSADPLQLKEAQPPGPMMRLDELAARHPHHHSLQYLESRHFDPIALGRAFGVSYCAESKYSFARDRIIIPIYERGILYGWQARYIGDDFNGTPLKEWGIPKYWTMPGTPKRIVGYNMERAVRHQTIMVVEGPADVWGAGVQSFGILGKSLDPEMAKKLRKWISLYWKDNAVVVVLLDPDQDQVSKAEGKLHHIEQTANVLRETLGRGLADRVVPVYLPSGTDPGNLDRVYMREIIRSTAEKLGLEVHFDKKSQMPASSAG